jgi:hypothetical protein
MASFVAAQQHSGLSYSVFCTAAMIPLCFGGGGPSVAAEAASPSRISDTRRAELSGA